MLAPEAKYIPANYGSKLQVQNKGKRQKQPHEILKYVVDPVRSKRQRRGRTRQSQISEEGQASFANADASLHIPSQEAFEGGESWMEISLRRNAISARKGRIRKQLHAVQLDDVIRALSNNVGVYKRELQRWMLAARTINALPPAVGSSSPMSALVAVPEYDGFETDKLRKQLEEMVESGELVSLGLDFSEEVAEALGKETGAKLVAQEQGRLSVNNPQQPGIGAVASDDQAENCQPVLDNAAASTGQALPDGELSVDRGQHLHSNFMTPMDQPLAAQDTMPYSGQPLGEVVQAAQDQKQSQPIQPDYQSDPLMGYVGPMRENLVPIGPEFPCTEGLLLQAFDGDGDDIQNVGERQVRQAVDQSLEAGRTDNQASVELGIPAAFQHLLGWAAHACNLLNNQIQSFQAASTLPAEVRVQAEALAIGTVKIFKPVYSEAVDGLARMASEPGAEHLLDLFLTELDIYTQVTKSIHTLNMD